VHNLDKDAFAGTAEYYARYRLPYPGSLFEDLLSAARISPDAALLDLGCGPGRIALALAPRFREVWAVDQEQEMIALGQQNSQGIENIRWIVASAEKVAIPGELFELITVGEAFHRFDGPLVAKRALRWLRPRGTIAMLWYVNVWEGHEQWHKVAAELVRRYAPRHSQAPVNHPPFEQTLSEAGFQDLRTREFQVAHTWSPDTLLGYFFSTSILSRRALGARAARFESELRERLSPWDQGPGLQETATFAYLMATRGEVIKAEESPRTMTES
jgi:ubiquinone/menaquinone biosynthesis C-methylase UbiE